MQKLLQFVGCALFNVVINAPNVALSQDKAAPLSSSPALNDLSSEEYKALEKVTENSVTGTISFLASDELAGRGTPSKEFLIATSYVASRLRAAGAKGLGKDGSYFLESTVDSIRTPASGCSLQIAAGKPPQTTLLSAVEQAVDYSGTIPLIGESNDAAGDHVGPVAIAWDDKRDGGATAMASLRKRANALATKKATAVVVIAAPESELWQFAKLFQKLPRLENPRNRLELPIVLVTEQTWKSDSRCELKIPAVLHEKATVRNVAAVLEGSDSELNKQAIIYSAHLDHLGDTGTGEDKIFNGADDDASGVTAVLTLADAFGALEPRAKRSVIFLTFWGEERGMLGSKEFVAASPWPLDQVVANINIEMVGRPEEGARNKFWMTGWNESSLGPIIASGSRRVGVENFEHPSLSARLYGASDNISFVNHGVVAHSFSAGSLHSDYHQPTDEWQRLDLPHMTQVIRGLYAGTLPIAQGELTPSKK